MILGIETSCDETALALFDPGLGIVGEVVSSQIELHAAYGGVVPDLASREHLRLLGPLLAGFWERYPVAQVSGVCVTAGPGLAACLAMGVTCARSLGLALRVPVTPVNHLRAHALSPFLPVHAAAPAAFCEALEGLLPHLGLIVSGGNTVLFSLEHGGLLRVLAETHDDAAGEALDKGAKLLGLGYPGGPRIEQLARQGNPTAYRFPKPIPHAEDRRFSFSGLKTALRNQVEALGAALEPALPDLCASYQAAVIEALVRKAGIEARARSFASLGLSGGVANNRSLRNAWQELAAATGATALIAEPRHTGDNAAMIAFAGWCDATVLGLDPSVGIAGGGERWEADPAWRLSEAGSPEGTK